VDNKDMIKGHRMDKHEIDLIELHDMAVRNLENNQNLVTLLNTKGYENYMVQLKEISEHCMKNNRDLISLIERLIVMYDPDNEKEKENK